MNSTTDAAHTTTPNIPVYVAMGRARLATREELARLEAERQEQERREAILQAWKPRMARIEQTLPPGFTAYIVQPTEKPTEFYDRTLYRPLVLDLSPLGLGPLGAVLEDAADDGVGWIPPMAQQDEDTGRKALYLPDLLDTHEIRCMAHTFVEALALAQDAANEVEAHNAPLAAPPPNPYMALAGKGCGCYPVLRVSDNRAEAHAFGAADAEKFGALYGADGWLANMAVHTFTFPEAPVEGGSLYAYLALVPVAPDKWAALVGAGGAAA